MEKEILRENRGVRPRYYAIAVLAVFCAGLVVYGGIDMKSDAARERYYAGLNETEMKSAAYFLLDDIEKGDGINAYHNAKTAAEYARKAGLVTEAEMLDGMAGRLADGDGKLAEEEILSLRGLTDGEIVSGDGYADGDTGESDGLLLPQEEAHPVYGRLDILNQWKERRKRSDLAEQAEQGGEYIQRRVRETAEENVKKLLGVRKLSKELVMVGGNILYTCKNAYASLSPDSALPLEFALSLPRKPAVLGDEECVRSAGRFVEDFFPGVRAEADFAGVSYEDGNVRVNYVSSGNRITVLVERGAGKVIGLAVV